MTQHRPGQWMFKRASVRRLRQYLSAKEFEKTIIQILNSADPRAAMVMKQLELVYSPLIRAELKEPSPIGELLRRGGKRWS